MPVEPARAESANVYVPPPLYYVTGLIGGFLIGFLFPVPSLPSQITTILGSGFIAFALALGFSAIHVFRRAHTTVLPHRPSTAIVVAGPFRYSRNPMYIGQSLLYIGIAVLTQWLWALILLPIVLVLIDKIVIAREEAYLEQRFGAEYLRYKTQVRRWL